MNSNFGLNTFKGDSKKMFKCAIQFCFHSFHVGNEIKYCYIGPQPTFTWKMKAKDIMPFVSCIYDRSCYLAALYLFSFSHLSLFLSLSRRQTRRQCPSVLSHPQLPSPHILIYPLVPPNQSHWKTRNHITYRMKLHIHRVITMGVLLFLLTHSTVFYLDFKHCTIIAHYGRITEFYH